MVGMVFNLPLRKYFESYMTKSLVKKRIVLLDDEEVMVLNIVLDDVTDIMINNHALTRLKSSR